MKPIEFYTTPEGDVTMRPLGESERQLKETDTEIADKLFISLNTVNNHKKNSFKKVGVHSMPEFMRYAMAKKLF